MKLIVATHKLPYGITMYKNKDEAIKFEQSKPLITNISHRSKFLDKTKIAECNGNTLKCFQKPVHSTFWKNLYTEQNKNILYVGIPDFYNENISKSINDYNKNKIKKYLDSKHCKPVFLDFSQFQGDYNEYASKKLINIFFQRSWDDIFVDFDENMAFSNYVKLNEIFADSILESYEDGDIIYITSHELWLLPSILKKKNPQIAIGLTVHLPFPNFISFKKIPNAEKLLKSICESDIIEFQHKKYVKNFEDVCFKILGYSDTLLEFSNISSPKYLVKYRKSFITVNKIGIEYEIVKFITERHKCKEIQRHYQHLCKKTKIIVIISNINHGIMIKDVLLAIEGYLHKYGNNISVFLIEIPDGIIDTKVQMEISKTQSFILKNYQLSRFEILTSVDDDLYFGLLKSADLGIITSDRSVLSRPILDFIASQENKCAPLIVPENTTCYENFDIIRINPKNTEKFINTIHSALEKYRSKSINQKDIEWIKSYSTTKYIKNFIRNMEVVKNLREEEHLKCEELDINLFSEKYKQSKERVFLLDYDGTLMEICSKPEDAKPTQEIINLLDNLCKIQENTVCLVTGRSKEDAENWFSNPNLILYAEHGNLVKINGKWSLNDCNINWMRNAENIIRHFIDRTPNSSMEQKTTSIAFHYRNCDPLIKEVQVKMLRNTLKDLVPEADILNGKEVLEIKVKGKNKGNVAKIYSKSDFIVALGDDLTDEDMFKSLKENKNAITICVGKKDSAAKFCLESPERVRNFLKFLVENGSKKI